MQTETCSEDRTAIEAVDELVARMIALEEQSLRRKPSPQHTPRASGIEHCERAMKYQITHWDVRPEADSWVAARMRRGSEIEERIITPRLQELGLKVVATHMPFELKGGDGRVLCTGTIDGLLEAEDGTRIVFDVKTAVPWLWQGVRDGAEGVQDLLDSPWMHRYVWQILLYAHGMLVPGGLIILDDCLGHVKYVPIMVADHPHVLGEALLKCNHVIQALWDGNDLPYHDDASECGRCRWFQAGICSPPLDYSAGGIQFLASAAAADAMVEMERFNAEHRLYQAAERRFKAAVGDPENGSYLCGDFRLTVGRRDRKGYAVEPGVTVTRTWERFMGQAAKSKLDPVRSVG